MFGSLHDVGVHLSELLVSRDILIAHPGMRKQVSHSDSVARIFLSKKPNQLLEIVRQVSIITGTRPEIARLVHECCVITVVLDRCVFKWVVHGAERDQHSPE